MAPRISTLVCGVAAALAAGGVLFVQPNAGSRPRVPEYGLATEAASSQLPGASAEESTSSVQSLLLGAALGLAVGLAGLAATPAYATVGPEPPKCSDVLVSVRSTAQTQNWNLIPYGLPLGIDLDTLKMIPRDPKTGAQDATAYKICKDYNKWVLEKDEDDFAALMKNRAKNHPEYPLKSQAHRIQGTGKFLKEIGYFPFDIRKGSNNYTADGDYVIKPWNGPTAEQQAQQRALDLEKEAKRRQGVFSYIKKSPGPVVAGKYNPITDASK